MSSKKKKRVCILGAGSIGSLFGGYLASHDFKDFELEIIFICRALHQAAINEKGLKIQSRGRIIHTFRVTAYDNPFTVLKRLRECKDFNIDYLIISTKTRDLENVLKEYEEIIKLSSFIVLLQNGIENEELVAKYAEKRRIIRIITSHGAFLKTPGYVIHTGEGFLKMGFPFNPTQNTKELNFLQYCLTLSGLKSEVVNNINIVSWEKAFINIGINPLGALTRLRNGDLLKDVQVLRVMKSLISESVIVARQTGLNMPKKNYFKLAMKIASETKNNQNSMLQDILASKKTEIDFLNGKIVDLAKNYEIEVPTNHLITILIKGLEKSFN